jgi:hypothetical protein
VQRTPGASRFKNDDSPDARVASGRTKVFVQQSKTASIQRFAQDMSMKLAKPSMLAEMAKRQPTVFDSSAVATWRTRSGHRQRGRMATFAVTVDSKGRAIEEMVLANDDPGTAELELPPWWVCLFCARDVEIEGGYILTKRGIVHPRSSFRQFWRRCSATLLVMTFMFVPFSISFEYEPFAGEQTNMKHVWAVALRVIDVFFVMDIVVRHRLAFWRDGLLVQDPVEIRKRFHQGWRGLDYVAALLPPLIEIVCRALGIASQSLLSASRLPRLLKLVCRIWQLRTAAESGIRLAMYVLALTHVLGCSFHAISIHEARYGESSWLEGHFGQDFEAASRERRYLAAAYWAVTTLTTVGYGDIVPMNDWETAFATGSSLLGCAVFACVVGRMTTLAQRTHASENAFAEKMDSVEEFMRFHSIPTSMSASIRMHYSSTWTQQVYFNNKAILGERPAQRHISVSAKSRVAERGLLEKRRGLNHGSSREQIAAALGADGGHNCGSWHRRERNVSHRRGRGRNHVGTQIYQT